MGRTRHGGGGGASSKPAMHRAEARAGARAAGRPGSAREDPAWVDAKPGASHGVSEDWEVEIAMAGRGRKTFSRQTERPERREDRAPGTAPCVRGRPEHNAGNTGGRSPQPRAGGGPSGEPVACARHTMEAAEPSGGPGRFSVFVRRRLSAWLGRGPGHVDVRAAWGTSMAVVAGTIDD